MSRSPPWASFRSGSSRKATSPWARWRSSTWSARTGSHCPGLRRHRSSARASSGVDDLGVPGHQATVEQAELGPQVVGGHVEDLGRPADRVVEAHPLVPDRIPDGVGDGADVPPTLVDEDHVEVAAGTELAPAVAADRHQSEAPEVPVGGVVQEPRQPGVGGVGQGMAEVVAVEVGSLEKLLAQARRDTGDGTTGPRAPVRAGRA